MDIILGVIGGMGVLLTLILVFRLPAFISLLLSTIITGLIVGMEGAAILDAIKEGLGTTLGFVAVVVGLGAMFGAILEKSNGALGIANSLVKMVGNKKAPAALMLTGFLVAIPVFFDVAFIIMVPVIYALQRLTGKSLLLYAIPLLAGIAVTHTFVPPTPGPIAVADILHADMGWVILFGILSGIPVATVSGLLYGKFIAGKIHIAAPPAIAETQPEEGKLPRMWVVVAIIFLPIVLILSKTMVNSGIIPITNPGIVKVIDLLGHPFTALIIANIVVWIVLGLRSGFTSAELTRVSVKSMEPAGVIILLTGAGGAFKQVLVETGAGKLMAVYFAEWGLPLIVFGFLAAALIRILQGSATVAMITAAGLVAPVVGNSDFSQPVLASLVIAIASGASILSHVNDSGFWLVKEYLGMSEQQTFRSWTMMMTLLALTGFACSLALYYIFI